MGIIANIKAMKDVERIKFGGTANLSIAQISNLLINLPDAQKHLSQDEFSKVYSLYRELQKCKTKMNMDIDGYYETAIQIIKRFDAIAPYEKYSGGNELEYSFMMEELRKMD